MKVLVFTDEFDYSYFTFVYNEIKYLQKSGVEVYVVCERTGKLTAADINFSCIPHSKNSFLRILYLQAYKHKLDFILSWFKFYRKRKKIIKEFKPDIIQTHFGDTAVRIFFPLKKTIGEIPFLVSFHGFDAASLLKQAQYTGRLKALAKYHNFFAIYVSRHLLKNLLEKDITIDQSKAFLLHYGVDPSQFCRNRNTNNPVKTFLQVSSFSEKKGHLYTLQAFKKFHDLHTGKARLVIGGDGPSKDKLLVMAEELGIINEVEFKGWVTRENAVALMNEADYFVHHSVTGSDGDQEGLPNALIEAMAMELPVISTYHSGIPELVENNINGYLVEERDIDAYAKRMSDILTWTYLPVNREKVVKHFSLDIHTSNLLAIYKTALAN